MAAPQLISLIHLAGFGTGVVLYAMLAVMTWRDVARSPDRAEAATRLPLVAAMLGLTWNLGALVIYGLRDFGLAAPTAWLTGVAFAALGFLPAVVVHSTRARGQNAGGRLSVVLAYALSGAAALLFVSGVSPSTPSPAALTTLTGGYALLVTLVGMDVIRHRGETRSHIIAMVALAAFAGTAVHMGHDARQADPWFVALLGHHASIPLVMVILYLDYRFAFADLFLRRALAIVALVVVATVLHVAVAGPLLTAAPDAQGETLLATAGHIALWVITALLYPALYRWSSQLVDRVILRRSDYRALRHDVAFVTARAESEADAASAVSRMLAAGLDCSPDVVRWETRSHGEVTAHARVLVTPGARNEAQVLVPTVEAPTLVLQIGPLPAGRRLLSDEDTVLEAIATMLGRRIDVLRVTRERFARDLRERELAQLATEAELRALRAQLNPHFLFNALTTIGYLMQAAPERALGTLYRLTGLLRAVLRGPADDLVPLGDELDFVEAYLAIEQERFQERLQVRIEVPNDLRDVRIPPLLLQPLVENAVQHGISPLRRGGMVSVTASYRATERGPVMELIVADTGRGFDPASRQRPNGMGVGLANIENRLDKLYGPDAALTLSGQPDRGTTAVLCFPVATDAGARLDAERARFRHAG